MTVAELGQRMGSRELERWKAYHGVTPSRARSRSTGKDEGLAMLDRFYGIR